MKKISKIILATLSICLLSTTIFTQTVQAENKESTYSLKKDDGYYQYKPAIQNIYQGEAIQHEESFTLDYNQVKEVIVNVDSEAHYIIKVTYRIPNDNVLPTALELKINGAFPYNELRNITFNNLWQRKDEVILDRYDNEIVPDIESINDFQKSYIQDSSGREQDPLLIPLNQGINTLSFKSTEGSIEITSISLEKLEYVALPKDQVEVLQGKEKEVIEAEKPKYQNSPSTRPGSWFNLDLTPYDNKNKKLNYIDGLSFKEASQFVEYEFEVEGGDYHLGFRYLQDAKVDFSVFANIYIDGQLMNQSSQNYPFPYVGNFSDEIMHNENGNLVFNLSPGKHTLRIELSISPLQDILQEIESIISEIQTLSITIKNLVGNVVDKNRNFEILEYIPDVENQLNDWIERLNTLYIEAQELQNTDKTMSAFASLKIAEKQLKSIVSKRREIHIRVNELSTGSNSITAHLGSFLEGMNNNGLSLDKIFLIQNSKDTPEKASLIHKMGDGIKRFFTSFGSQDYTTNSQDSENLQVWVNRPRQYIEILQNMIDKDFTPKTGVKVDLSIMPDSNKLILANAAGNAPDVALGVNYALPFDLAIRNAILDLREFEDFEAIASRFPEKLHIPATIGNSIYAMPETMNFYVMFYRKDILDNIGMQPFDTMDDVVANLPILHQQGLNFFYPTAGMASMKIFAGTMPVIYQNGGDFFGETINRTQLNSKETIEGFKKLTDLFTIYNLPYDVPSFYQQFRDGSLPAGIADYGAYNLLTNAAPEIANLWDIALMPGYVNEEGIVDRTSSGGAESSIIFSDTQHKDASWDFIKWWSSAETQTDFGTTLQTSYGKEYMWNTANLESFAKLPWKTQHKQVILEQSQWIEEVPRVLGTYMLEREVSNAYNSVVLDGMDLRRAIDLASKRINRETNRKLEEFGYIKDGVIIKEYPTPTIEGWKDNEKE